MVPKKHTLEMLEVPFLWVACPASDPRGSGTSLHQTPGWEGMTPTPSASIAKASNDSHLHSYFPQRLGSQPSGEGLPASPATSPLTGTEGALGPASIRASCPPKPYPFNLTVTLRARKPCETRSRTGH